jgi:hypothetical protein
MPRVRWVDLDGTRWRLSELARAHGLAPGTLSDRLDRGMPAAQAVRERPVDATTAARIGRARARVLTNGAR